MNLEYCLKRLALGELSNLHVVDKETKTIKEEHIPLVVSCINDGLTQLYTRFLLKEDSIIVTLYDGKVTYELTSEHNIISGSDYDHYIYKEYNKQFNDDIIKIINVVLSNGMSLPLNDHNSTSSIYTPRYNVIEVPLDLPNEDLGITYQANHPKLDYSKDLNQEIELPEAYHLALFNYVAYLIHSNMNKENAVQNSQKYLNNYNLIINSLIESGVNTHSDFKDNSKFSKRGWC